MSCEHVKNSLDKKFEKHYFLYTHTLTHIYSNDCFTVIFPYNGAGVHWTLRTLKPN